MHDTAFEPDVQALGATLSRLAGQAPPTLFDPGRWRGRIMLRAMQDPALRSALFQFVDVLPALQSDQDIARHFHDYLLPYADRLPGCADWWYAVGVQNLLAPALRRMVNGLARQFVTEEQPRHLAETVQRLARIPAAVTLDAVGEAALSEQECAAYAQRYLRLLDLLPRCGPLLGNPPIHLSIKLSALTAQFDPLDYAGVRRRVFARLEPIVARLRALRGGLTVDMEQHERKDLTLRLFRDWVEAESDGQWFPGIALQAYLPTTSGDLAALIDWARRRRQKIAIRLVKGAYWDSEIALAAQRNWPVPVWCEKSATDAHYEQLLGVLFEHTDFLYPAVASHNLRCLAYASALAARRGLATGEWEVQMLYGMAEPLRHAVAAMGTALRVYVPTGALLPGVAHLIRRLLENTANTSILRQTYVEGMDLHQLLAPPAPARSIPAIEASPDCTAQFANTALQDFSQIAVAQSFQRALTVLRAERLGHTFRLRIVGVPADGVGFWTARNPAQPEEILGRVAVADVAHAGQAVANARRAFPDWRDTPAAQRVAWCRRVADAMAARRAELAAWQVLEVGKNWREADADVAEAVDFLRYYAQGMESLAEWRPTLTFPGETNQLGYAPRGVAVVIPPWNFPLAILVGMTAAALVTGNTVIIKPASPANLVAQSFYGLLESSGLPQGVCQLLPGDGSLVGDYLVGHPEVHLIAFTGSRAVGLNILRRAHTPAPGQTHVKQVVCEMGGKNAIIVDDDADLDEAVAQTLYSAFGYQGQKCSACSRVIAVGPVHDRFVERLAAALDSYPYGPPEYPAHLFGPLISSAAQRNAMAYLEIGQREGQLRYLGRVPELGYYCPPAIFTGIEPHHRLAQEEIFAPLLAVLHAPTFEAALDYALASDYALTGGVFSRLPAHIQLARERYRVGNLYINRGITGARVGVQPFGGVRLSGTGIQAGGPDYLKQFLWTRVVSENTLRHGFMPVEAC